MAVIIETLVTPTVPFWRYLLLIALGVIIGHCLAGKGNWKTWIS